MFGTPIRLAFCQIEWYQFMLVLIFNKISILLTFSRVDSRKCFSLLAKIRTKKLPVWKQVHCFSLWSFSASTQSSPSAAWSRPRGPCRRHLVPSSSLWPAWRSWPTAHPDSESSSHQDAAASYGCNTCPWKQIHDFNFNINVHCPLLYINSNE